MRMRFGAHGWAVAGLAVMLAGGQAFAAGLEGDLPQVTFRLERPGVRVPEYKITVGRDGRGVYEGEESQSVQGGVDGDAGAADARPFHNDIALSHATTEKIFDTARGLKEFRMNCGTKARNIANTGAKTLKYKGPEGESECSFNYSDSKPVMQLTEMFEAIAETMNEGRELDHLHRYDRLGLDAAIAVLADEVSTGRALELNTIAGTLRSIAADTEVMQRVRLAASRLLSQVPADMQRASE